MLKIYIYINLQYSDYSMELVIVNTERSIYVCILCHKKTSNVWLHTLQLNAFFLLF